MFAGESLLYAVHFEGYDTIDTSEPFEPVILAEGNTTLRGWKQIVTNGNGLGLAAVGVNSTDDGPHQVSIYDVSDPFQTSEFLTQFETPGLAAAVTIYNGLGYIADSQAGLQVINYLAFDALGQAPSATLATNFAENRAEEGQLMRLTVTATDDVQVRNVEFYVDDVLIAIDGNFPFEHRFVTPLLADQLTFEVKARAVDTGGNATFTATETFELVPDATPPAVLAVAPEDNEFVFQASAVATRWSENIDPSTLTDESWIIRSAGADGIFETSDDQLFTGAPIFREALQPAYLSWDRCRLETTVPAFWAPLQTWQETRWSSPSCRSSEWSI